jgi:hypothetical protein
MTPGLEGHTYDCCDSQAVLFISTTKEISGFVRREFCSAPRPPSGATDMDIQDWKDENRFYRMRTFNRGEGMARLYNIVYGQCSDIMIQKLTAMGGFETDIVAKSDALELLKAIRQITFNFESQKFEAHAIHAMMCQFYNQKQSSHMTAQSYLEHFTNNVNVVTLCGGTIGTFGKLAQSLAKERNLNTSTLTDTEKATLKNDARERYILRSHYYSTPTRHATEH